MSTKNIIRLAQKFQYKYADTHYETIRMATFINNGRPSINTRIRDIGTALTLELYYNSGWFSSGKIDIQNIRYSPARYISEENKDYIRSIFVNELLPFLNIVDTKFEDGPWWLVFGGPNGVKA